MRAARRQAEPQGRSIIFFYPPLEKGGQGGFESGKNMSDMESIVI